MEQIRSRAGAHDVVEVTVPLNTLLLAEDAAAAAAPPRIRSYEELDGATGRAVFFRPHRFTAADLSPLRGTVSVGLDGSVHECALRDVSQNGVAFDWAAGVPLREGQAVRLTIAFDGHALWTGIARVSREDEEVVAASFGRALLDTDELLQLRSVSAWAADGVGRASDKPWHTPGHHRFKALVAELRLFLEDAEQRLADLEKAVPWHAIHDRESPTRSALVRRLRTEVGADVRRFALEIDAARREASPREASALKEFSLRQLQSFLMQVPWMHRARHKPFGYPGDYELMNFFYENDFEGQTLFARALGHAFIETPCALAVPRRKDLMRRHLRSILEQGGDAPGPARFLSIAAGPARELQELLAEIEDLPRDLEIVLFEQDQGALAHAYKRLRPLADARFPGRVRIVFLNESIKRLLRDATLFDPFGKFDAVYSCGLFDYLQDATAVRLARNLFAAAAPGGRVFIANMVDHAGRWFVEDHLDWHLLYRTREKLAEIGRRAAPGAQVRVLEEETGVNPFIELARS